MVPEVNPEDIKDHKGIIANPNCSTIIMNVPVWPLHAVNPIRRIMVSTYQAVSGAGAWGLWELDEQMKAYAAGTPIEKNKFPHQIVNNVFSEDLLEQKFKFITDTIVCGRPGKAMAPWGESQGGKFSDEQIRQLVVLITEGRWDLAQAHADEIDAEATNHATVRMPDGLLDASDTELVVSNADPFFVDQYIRIEGERLQITEIPSTGQRVVEETGRTPRGFMVSGADGIDIGAVVRVDAELME